MDSAHSILPIETDHLEPSAAASRRSTGCATRVPALTRGRSARRKWAPRRPTGSAQWEGHSNGAVSTRSDTCPASAPLRFLDAPLLYVSLSSAHLHSSIATRHLSLGSPAAGPLRLAPSTFGPPGPRLLLSGYPRKRGGPSHKAAAALRSSDSPAFGRTSRRQGAEAAHRQGDTP